MNKTLLEFSVIPDSTNKADYMKRTFFKSKVSLIALILLFSLAHHSYSQKFLLLQKGSNTKTALRFQIGEEITYKSTKFDYFVTDVIVDIKTDIIVLSENILQPKDITVVDIRNKDQRNQTIKNLSFLSMGAGVIFLLVNTVNSLYQQGDLSRLEESWALSAGLIAGGFVISKLRYKEFKHKGDNKIQIVILYGD
ncbi:hypothetical protein MMU07_15115 [Aquiflexum sp. LQ15W]|uniref:hypothetical protein n=1 Tax=Cognataquiflexum nitidum TaxID=2922272 RepID=UPI001F13A1B0|nr:hypothetical protein [Cognataquiflexum nitidum]